MNLSNRYQLFLLWNSQIILTSPTGLYELFACDFYLSLQNGSYLSQAMSLYLHKGPHGGAGTEHMVSARLGTGLNKQVFSPIPEHFSIV